MFSPRGTAGRWIVVARCVAAVGAAGLAIPAVASAGTIAVTSNADSGAGSLRAALAAAGSGDTITIPAMTITLTSGALPVTKGITIEGSGARATTVSGNNSSGVFDVQAPGVTIENLTITKGHTVGDGGGVFTNSGLTLSHVAIVDNTAALGGGRGRHTFCVSAVVKVTVTLSCVNV